MRIILICILASFAFVQGDEVRATCRVTPNPSYQGDDDNVSGMVYLTQEDEDGPTTIELDLSGFNTDDDITLHGFHVHVSGDLVDGCNSFGGHYNPLSVNHGAPTNDMEDRHFGDLGNIEENPDGTLRTTITDSLVMLSGEFSTIGRGIIVHEKEDDLGLGGDEGSITTGNAGARLACCVIGLSDGSNWPSK